LLNTSVSPSLASKWRCDLNSESASTQVPRRGRGRGRVPTAGLVPQGSVESVPCGVSPVPQPPALRLSARPNSGARHVASGSPTRTFHARNTTLAVAIEGVPVRRVALRLGRRTASEPASPVPAVESRVWHRMSRSRAGVSARAIVSPDSACLVTKRPGRPHEARPQGQEAARNGGAVHRGERVRPDISANPGDERVEVRGTPRITGPRG
jgi:hypothetical protein